MEPALASKFGHRLDQQAAPPTASFKMQRITLLHAVVGPCLDKDATVEIQVPFKFLIEVIQGKVALDLAQEQHPRKVTFVRSWPPELLNLESESTSHRLYVGVLWPLGIIQDYRTSELHFVEGMLKTGGPRATVNQHEIEGVILISLNRGRIISEREAGKSHIG